MTRVRLDTPLRRRAVAIVLFAFASTFLFLAAKNLRPLDVFRHIGEYTATDLIVWCCFLAIMSSIPLFFLGLAIVLWLIDSNLLAKHEVSHADTPATTIPNLQENRTFGCVLWIVFVFALPWGAVTAMMIPQSWRDNRGAIVGELMLPLVVLTLLAFAIRSTVISFITGRLECRLSALPHPGQRCSGQILLPAGRSMAEPFTIRLSCLDMQPFFLGGNGAGSYVPKEVWRETIETSAVPTAGGGYAIPFHFVIPQNSRETGEPAGDGTTIWRLQMKGKLALTTIYASFDLPVFRESSSVASENLARYDAARKNIVNLLDEG